MKTVCNFAYNNAFPLMAWVVWIVLVSILSYAITSSDIPMRLGYRYTDIGVSFGLPEWLGVRANFDGVLYMTIAREHYSVSQIAFFPLYPFILSLVSSLASNNTLLAGIVLSSLLTGASLLIWYRVFQSLLSPTQSRRALVSFLTFPTAFFMLNVYTESLFVVLFGVYVWGVIKRKWWLVVGAGIALGLTRLAGVFTIGIPLMMYAAHLWDTKQYRTPPIHLVSIFLAPLMGLCGYMAYLWAQTGDALAFFTAQEQFNNARSTSLVLLPQVIWRYLSIFITAQVDVVYVVAVVEFVMFVLVASLLVYAGYAWWRKAVEHKHLDERQQIYGGLILFSVINLLVPTLTGTLGSIPRYALVGMALYPAIAALPSQLRHVIWVCFGMLQIILMALFAQGWFVS